MHSHTPCHSPLDPPFPAGRNKKVHVCMHTYMYVCTPTCMYAHLHVFLLDSRRQISPSTYCGSLLLHTYSLDEGSACQYLELEWYHERQPNRLISVNNVSRVSSSPSRELIDAMLPTAMMYGTSRTQCSAAVRWKRLPASSGTLRALYSLVMTQDLGMNAVVSHSTAEGPTLCVNATS